MSETVVGEKGMVVAPHRAAAEAGAEVMRAGGNAVEAMIAAAATIAVVYPHMNGPGGNSFFLIAQPNKPPQVIDASGRAGALATIEHYESRGYDRLPYRGASAAITVAGAVSGWEAASEAARALGGRLSRQDLFGDALACAREGIVVSRSEAEMTASRLDELKPISGFAAHFLIDGKLPEAGARLRQGKLADTLEHLVHAGFADFYRGDVAAAVAADLEEFGSPVTRADLEKHERRVVRALELAVGDMTLFNAPPPTQGVASMIILALYDRLRVERGDSFEHIHGLIEAAKRAYRVRDEEVADPDHAGDLAPYLDPEWLDAEAEKIDMRRATPWRPADSRGDTVWLGAIDGNGLAVSFIQSIYWEFGSGLTLPRTGVLWHNRGSSFSLDERSRNALAPGKKPFHTLNPALARFRDGRVMVYGSMGGDAQPQFQSALFTRHVHFGMDIGEAVAAPRWRLGGTWRDGAAELEVENRFDPDLVAALERAGHRVAILPEAYSDDMGHAGAIVRRADGRLFGASDPRSDGAAVAA